MKYRLTLPDFEHNNEVLSFFIDNTIYFRCLVTTKNCLFFGVYEFDAEDEDIAVFSLKFNTSLNAKTDKLSLITIPKYSDNSYLANTTDPEKVEKDFIEVCIDVL